MVLQLQSVCFLLTLVVGYTLQLHIPKPLTVDCESLGNADEFKHRLKWRKNAEDKTTILLKKGEQLNIHIELEKEATLDILDVRYSNDGDWDEIELMLDGEKLGTFKTIAQFRSGKEWNHFRSSGPIGGPHKLKAGQHSFALKVVEADVYGVEIDYVRFDVQGGAMHRLDKHDFLCVHSPLSKQMNGTQNDHI